MQIRRLLQGVGLVIALLSPAVQGQTLDDPEELTSISDVAELRRLVDQEPAAGLSRAQLNDSYRLRSQAAQRLFLPMVRETILRRWVKDAPDHVEARSQLWWALIGNNRWDEGLQVGESVLRDTRPLRPRVRVMATLAEAYVEAGNPQRSAELLREGAEIAAADFRGERVRGNEAFQTQFTLMRLRASECLLALSEERVAQAIERCRQADGHGASAAEAARRLPDATVGRNAAIGHFLAVLRMGQVQLRAGRPFDAEETARRAIALARGYDLARLGVLQAGRFIVQARLARHDYTGAERALTQVLNERGAAEADAVPGQFLVSLAGARLQILVGQGRWRDARTSLDTLDAQVAGNEFAQRMALNLHARALTWIMDGRASQALPLLRDALKADQATYGPDHVATGFTRGLLGMALAAGGDVADQALALPELQRATATLMAPSGLGEAYLNAGLRQVYRRLILERYLDLATRGTPDAATVARTFQVADHLRGSVVQRAMADAALRSAASSAGLADIVRRDQDAANELRALHELMALQSAAQRGDAVLARARERMVELERLRATARAQIARQFPDYDRLVNPQPPTPAEVAARLREGEVFVALWPSAQQVHVWAVGRGGTAHHRADLADADLKGLVQRTLRTLDVAGAGRGMPAFDAAAGSRLYERLLKPVEGAWGDARHLVFAPGGALGTLPLGVLLTTPWTVGDAAPAPWLIRRAAISHVASASAWMALTTPGRARPAPEALAAWGDPLFDAGRVAVPAATRTLLATRAAPPANAADATPLDYRQIPPLPETRQEVQAIAASLGADAERDAFFGARATRESVLGSSRSGLLQRKRVLVFATHGLAAGELPNLTQPALAMAADGSEQQDPLKPLLLLEDVLSLKLNADWVVLSACNTASGDGRADEALSGLARGFFYAGSRSLLVTHWAVETESAKALTTGTFEHHVAHPGASKAESLRQSMLQVMAQPRYAHPAFWAPYALVGDGGR